jgi:hypothetical protein
LVAIHGNNAMINFYPPTLCINLSIAFSAAQVAAFHQARLETLHLSALVDRVLALNVQQARRRTRCSRALGATNVDLHRAAVVASVLGALRARFVTVGRFGQRAALPARVLALLALALAFVASSTGAGRGFTSQTFRVFTSAATSMVRVARVLDFRRVHDGSHAAKLAVSASMLAPRQIHRQRSHVVLLY